MKKVLAGLLIIASLVVPTGGALAMQPQVNVTGTWQFSTSHCYLISGAYFTLVLQQSGTKVTGHDSNNNTVHGSVTGRKFSYTVYNQQGEWYSGIGTVKTGGKKMAGSCSDGAGEYGTFTAVKANG